MEKQTLLERFWSKVGVLGPDECWPWTASKNQGGYGLFKVAVGCDRAHRIAYCLGYAAQIPAGMHILHSCDNPACCNPKHLRVGTQKDNTHDMDARGRRVANQPKGERSHKAKLTELQVMKMRLVGLALSQKTLASLFGISTPHVYGILNRTYWGHLGQRQALT